MAQWKYMVLRERDRRSEGFAETEKGARKIAARLAKHENENMVIAPVCALIGETIVAPNDPRIDIETGEWKR